MAEPPRAAPHRAVAPERSLQSTHPELAAQLHPLRNGALTALDLSSGLARSVWWLCPNGHEWQASVAGRVAGRGCAQCVRSEPLTRSLANVHPELAAELHPSRNLGVVAEQLAPQSSWQVWWRCPRGHEWEARVYVRARGGGCPICVRQRVASERSLAHKLPALAAELHPERNPGIDASTLAAGSSRLVWWQCAAGHEWEARVYSRAAGNGCPRCQAGRAAAAD